MYPHDPAAIAYQQWLLQQQQQPAPQYAPQPTLPFAFPTVAQQLAAAAPRAPQQYMPPPLAPLAPQQYMPPPPAFQPSPSLSPASRRPRQPRQQSQSEPEGNELVSLSIVVLSLLIGAAVGAVGEHHRLLGVMDARLSTAVQAGVAP